MVENVAKFKLLLGTFRFQDENEYEIELEKLLWNWKAKVVTSENFLKFSVSFGPKFHNL